MTDEDKMEVQLGIVQMFMEKDTDPQTAIDLLKETIAGFEEQLKEIKGES